MKISTYKRYSCSDIAAKVVGKLYCIFGLSLFWMICFCYYTDAALSEDKLPNNTPEIGAVLPLTGIAANIGTDLREGMLLYSIQAKEKHLPLLNVRFEDGQQDLKLSLAAYNKLVDWHGMQIVFVNGTGPAKAIKPLADKNKTLLIVSSPEPGIASRDELIIQYANRIDNDARLLADAVIEKFPGANEVAMLSIQNDWGEYYGKCLTDSFAKNAPNVKLEKDTHLPEERDYKIQLIKLIAKKPEVFIVNSIGLPAAAIIIQLRQLGYSGPIFASVGFGLTSDAILALRGKNIKNFYYQTFPDVDQAFENEFVKQFNRKPGYASEIAYSAIELLADAVNHTDGAPIEVASYVKNKTKFVGQYLSVNISPEGSVIFPTMIVAYHE